MCVCVCMCAYVCVYIYITLYILNLYNVIFQRENHNSKTYMHSNVHCSTVYNSQDMEAI